MVRVKELTDFVESIAGPSVGDVKRAAGEPYAVDLLGEGEKSLDFSTQAGLVPDEEFPVGKKRIKETGITKGKEGTTFLAPAKTGGADIQGEAKMIKEAGEILEPAEATESLEKKIQASRPRIEKGLPAGFTFPEIEVKPGTNFYETPEDYLKRVQKLIPDPVSMQALKDEVAKQYAMRFPQFKSLAKNPDLLNDLAQGVMEDLENYIGEDYTKGLKLKSKDKSGIRKIITEALESAGYKTKDPSVAIDKSIEELIDKYPQDIERQFTTDPETGKAYTKTKIKSLIKNRYLMTMNKYYKDVILPQMTDEVLDEMRGDYSFTYLNKDKVKKIVDAKKAKYLAPFLTSMLTVIKEGGASELLRAGTGAALGIPLELAFSPEAEASPAFTEEELAELRIKQKFGEDEGILSLADLEARAKAQKEDRFDPYEAAGIPTFPEYLFGLSSIEDRENLEKLKKSK